MLDFEGFQAIPHVSLTFQKFQDDQRRTSSTHTTRSTVDSVSIDDSETTYVRYGTVLGDAIQ
jgi:hypothetical protein